MVRPLAEAVVAAAAGAAAAEVDAAFVVECQAYRFHLGACYSDCCFFVVDLLVVDRCPSGRCCFDADDVVVAAAANTETAFAPCPIAAHSRVCDFHGPV